MKKLLKYKNGQAITCGIFYCRVSANMKGCGSLQTLSWFDSDVLRNRQQKHTAVRYHKALFDIVNGIPNIKCNADTPHS